MAADEDVELRDLVTQSLENRGILGKIKAQLQASIFLTLEEQESDLIKLPLSNEPLKDFLRTADGTLLASLVREFLEYFNLEFALSVYDPETFQGKDYMYPGRDKLAKELQLEDINGKKGPLLLEVLRISKSNAVDKRTQEVNLTKSSNPPRQSESSAISNLLESTPNKGDDSASVKLPKKTLTSVPATASSSLSLLGDLPPLSKGPSLKMDRNPLDDLKLDLHGDEEEFSSISAKSRSDSSQKKNSSRKSTSEKNKSHSETKKSEPVIKDVSEADGSYAPSIEEDIEEEIEEMPEIDDLLEDSASGGEDFTRDESISKASGVADYLEEVWCAPSNHLKKAT